MLTDFHVGNFKAFAETQRIPIRPLTLVYGANSSGKSSLLHALMFASHAVRTGELDVHHIGNAEDQIDLGGFAQFVHQRNLRGLPELGFTFRINEPFKSGKSGRDAVLLKPGMSFDFRAFVSANNAPRTQFAVAGQPVATFIECDSNFRLPRLSEFNFEHPLVQRVVIGNIAALSGTSLSAADKSAMRKVLEEALLLYRMDTSNLVGREVVINDFDLLEAVETWPHLARLKEWMGRGAWEDLPKVKVRLRPGRRRKDLGEITLAVVKQFLDDLLLEARCLVSDFAKSTAYIGPLRAYPARDMFITNTRARGSDAWTKIANDQSLREKINVWLGDSQKMATPYRVASQSFVRSDLPVQIYKEILDEPPFAPKGAKKPVWSEILERVRASTEADHSDSPEATVVKRLSLIDQRSNTSLSHRDIGLGVSQVLPVLAAAYGSERTLHAIEQPELHLHPALQAELGDLFIESALGERLNTFLLETHSEHLLLRIMRRMRETASGKLPKGIPPLNPGDVAVIYVQPDGSRSVVREMPLNKSGELIKGWPRGFFEEGFRESFA